MEVSIHQFNPENAIKTETPNIFLTEIEGLLYVERPTFADERGFFREIGTIPHIEQITGIEFSVQQVNHSCSGPRVLRGIHAEGWNKLVTAITGTGFCALVDLRPDSSTFLSIQIIILKGGKGSLFIPQGVGNSLCVISSDDFNYVYAVDRLYSQRDPKDDRAVNAFDDQLNIPWPYLQDELILSERDRKSLSLADILSK
jgi:dTDP-4-dehydrorhamnose 3,5-epimerase